MTVSLTNRCVILQLTKILMCQCTTCNILYWCIKKEPRIQRFHLIDGKHIEDEDIEEIIVRFFDVDPAQLYI